MTSLLEYVHNVLAESGQTELLWHVEQAIQQRDRLLYGVNARYAELEHAKHEYALLKERYRLLDQKYAQLLACNRLTLEELKQFKPA